MADDLATALGLIRFLAAEESRLLMDRLLNKQKRREFSATVRRQLYDLQKGNCGICLQKLKGRYHVDHIVPLARGGTNDPSNLQVTHPRCNRDKRASDPFEHAQRRHGRLL